MTTPAMNLLHERVQEAVTELGTVTARQLTRHLYGPGWTEDEASSVSQALVGLTWMGALRVDGITYSVRS